jgi:hypothetical protein
VAVLAHLSGLDREKSFYATVLLVVGSYYLLFATMAGATDDLLPEMAFFGLFAAAAVVGFRHSMWIVVAGLAAHGLFDFVRGGFLAGSGVPVWWPGFCGSYDVAAAAILAVITRARMSGATTRP